MDYLYIEQVNEDLKANGMEFFRQQILAESTGAEAHIHDSIEMIYIEEGNFRIFVNESEFFAQKGDFLLFRSNEIHRIHANEEARNQYYVLKVRPSVFFEIASEKQAVGYILRLAFARKEKIHWSAEELRKSDIRKSFENLICEWNQEGLCRDISMKLGAYQVLLALLRDIIRRDEEHGSLSTINNNAAASIYRVIQYINSNYSEEIDAGKCAAMVNMSYSYFSRCFKRITGRNFKEYVNEVRISHAQQLLVMTDQSVTRIAAECGFNNVSYFITIYKSMKGETPFVNRKHV